MWLKVWVLGMAVREGAWGGQSVKKPYTVSCSVWALNPQLGTMTSVRKGNPGPAGAERGQKPPTPYIFRETLPYVFHFV